MKTRLLAAAAAALSVAPVMVLTTASPAAAADCRSRYVTGPARIRISPTFAQVRPGSIIELSSRVVRGSVNCTGIRVGYYLRNNGQRVFTIRDRQTTDANGLSFSRQRVTSDFRYYVATNELGRPSSGQGLVQARGRAL